MFKPISLYVGLRYTRAKRRNHFISFISLASVLGIALGVIVLITVLSVMNGFDFEIKKRIFGLTPQVTITMKDNPSSLPWEVLGKKTLTVQDVDAFAPFVNGQGMLTHSGQTNPVLVKGIVPSHEVNVSDVKNYFIEGSFDSLQAGEFGVVMGDDLAAQLGLMLGDKVNLLTAQGVVSPLGLLPSMKRFSLVGLFHVGGGFGLDQGVVYIHMKDAQVLYQMGNKITGIRLKVKGLYDAIHVSNHLKQLLGSDYFISNWTEEYGAYFHAIQMEKTMMFVLLLFIVAVAAFNLVSTMVMVVTDKRAEIAILKTLGATPRVIMSTFMVQGLFIGLIGVSLGLVGGVLLSLNVTQLVTDIEHWLNKQFISSSFYFINYLPSKLEWVDVFTVCGSALLMSLLAALYPAWQASRVQPAEALRYE